MKTQTPLAPVHPGEVLLEEFMIPLSLSQYRVAKDISVPPRRINQIVHGQRAISADTALRLGRYFGTSPQFWLNLQSHFDIEKQCAYYNNDFGGHAVRNTLRLREVAG